MIITKEINVRINGLNKKHFLKYYPNLNINDIITVPINLLMKGSKVIIKVKCDDCGKIRDMSFNVYRRYGDEYLCCKCVKKLTKETNLKKYGVERPLQSESIKEKAKKTNIKKYGVEYPLQNKKIQDKQRKTNLKKYGTDFVSNNKEIRNKQSIKRVINIIDKYKKNCDFVDYDVETKEIELLCDRGHRFKISRFNIYNRFKYETIICTECNPITNKKSGLEQELKLFLLDNQLIFEENNKDILKPYEIDIYFPHLKIGLEFNGTYWHNELYKSKNYHLNKTELAEKNNIHLIQIYEDDWIYKKETVKSEILRLLHKLINTNQSDYKIKEIKDIQVIRNFLDLNDIKGFTDSKIKIGLFLKNELISIMLFNKHENSFKIIRHCIKNNIGMIDDVYDIILNYFTKTYKPSHIIWELDRSWESRKLPESLGFKFVKKTIPNYYYVIGHKRYNHFNYRKDILVKNGKDSNLTEHEIMLSEKIYRIYDSGNLIYEKNI